MGQNKVTITQTDGGLGRQAPTLDHVSALLFEHTTAPSFWSGDKMRSFRSVLQLEQSGIAEQDIFYGIVHYQVSEYFRAHSEGEVYVGFEMLASGTDAAKAQAINAITNGRVRQFGVFVDDHTNTAQFQNLMDALENLGTDAVCLIGLEQPILFTAIPDLHARTQEKCHLIYSGDGDNVGFAYAQSLGENYLPSVGNALGLVSLSKVHESHAHVRQFNASDDKELASPIFGTGDLLKDVLKSTLDELHDKGWGFLTKQPGVSGSYWDDNRTMTATTSDYSSLNINRVSQKAARNVHAALVLEISGSVEVDPNTGKLSVGYVEFLKTEGGDPLFQMQQDGELSGYTVIIDDSQDILATSKIEATLRLVPKGVSRNFDVKLGFAVSVA